MSALLPLAYPPFANLLHRRRHKTIWKAGPPSDQLASLRLACIPSLAIQICSARQMMFFLDARFIERLRR